jgi:hypothetical protein
MLKDKLHLVIKYNIQPEDINTLIDEKPVIDTIDETDKNALLMADIIVDSTSDVGIAEIKKAKRVIYWKLSGTANAVNVAGIVWINDDTAHSFKGKILPPRTFNASYNV